METRHRFHITLLVCALFFATTVAAGSAMLARESAPSLAAGSGPRMSLAVTGSGVVCNAPPLAACSAPASSALTVTANVVEGPAGGYVGVQTELFYGDLSYLPQTVAQEIVWPEAALLARFPAAPAGNEAVVAHGALSGSSPPLPVSTHAGAIVQVHLACSAATRLFTIALVAYDPSTQPLGSGFRPAGSGDPAPVAAKSAGQRKLDLNDDGTSVTVGVADAVELQCGAGTPPSTETPGPTKTPVGTVGATGTRTATPTRTRTPTVTATLAEPVGDADCSGAVDSVDAALILQHAAGLIGVLPCAEAADSNGDGHIDSIDAALVLQLVAGLIDSLPP